MAGSTSFPPETVRKNYKVKGAVEGESMKIVDPNKIEDIQNERQF